MVMVLWLCYRSDGVMVRLCMYGVMAVVVLWWCYGGDGVMVVLWW